MPLQGVTAASLALFGCESPMDAPAASHNRPVVKYENIGEDLFPLTSPARLPDSKSQRAFSALPRPNIRSQSLSNLLAGETTVDQDAPRTGRIHDMVVPITSDTLYHAPNQRARGESYSTPFTTPQRAAPLPVQTYLTMHQSGTP